MGTWRCPHCGTPQREAARCWVCHRSTTSCSTCRHFRQGVTAKLGYCALDRNRAVLTGAEERACWERSPSEGTAGSDRSAAVIGLGLVEDDPDGQPKRAEVDRFELPDFLAEPAPEPAQDLWSLYLAGPSPVLELRRETADTTVRSAGMWVESSRREPALPPPQAPLTARHRNSRSVRHRPWGPVPGREDAFVRSLRLPDKVRRPRS